ncbi:tetratricopeptide repeat protein [Dactylosporangium sp. NPDC050588]|uniref:tetratricopeptide repeat protein n=1 Tax=Dactylosporangium sp. NPDC050588 TaxID=3157211 RepID=UPI0033D1DAB7
MSSVDTTAGPVPLPKRGFGARLAAVEELVATWDLHGAQEAARALLDEPGLPDGDRLTARRLLAEALRELGDLAAAYDLADAVATQAEQVYGPSDVSTVHAWAVLAAVRHDYDEWDAAEALYHRVLDSGVDETDPVTGAEAARVIRLARVNLALLQRDRGQRPLALAMLNAAYAVHRREYGADDLDTIRIAAELAALHRDDGNVPAARRLFTVAHAAARSRLGNRHPFTKAMEWELAAVEPPMPAALLHPAPVLREAAAVAGDAPEAADARSFAADVAAEDVDDPEPLPEPLPEPAERRVQVPAVVPEAVARERVVRPPAVVDAPAVARERVVRPPAVVDAPAVTHEASGPGDRSRTTGERRVVVPLKAVVAVAAGALVVAAVSIPWGQGGAPDRTTAKPPAGPTGTAAPRAGEEAAAGQGEGAPARVRDLRLRDDGTALAVTWTGLESTAVVALSRDGGPAVVLAQVPPGTTSYVVKGVDPVVAYCVVVGPVDAAAAVTPGASVCTGER